MILSTRFIVAVLQAGLQYAMGINMSKNKTYSNWFFAPAMVIFLVFFITPLVMGFYFSLTVWDFNGATFVGLDNYKMFFSERSLNISIRNTLIYAVLTSALKTILSFFIAIFLTSAIRTKNMIRSIVFFPNLVSAIVVGITFSTFMNYSKGLFNKIIGFFGIAGVDWLGEPSAALYSVIWTDVWKGLSIATVIFVSGIVSIDKTFYEAASIDGANGWQKMKSITLPLCRPAMNSIIILSFIGGLRSFELIWSMTGGGPGFATDVLSSVIYKQYASGFYGISTAGNVIMLVLVSLLAFPLQKFLMSKEVN